MYNTHSHVLQTYKAVHMYMLQTCTCTVHMYSCIHVLYTLMYYTHVLYTYIDIHMYCTHTHVLHTCIALHLYTVHIHMCCTHVYLYNVLYTYTCTVHMYCCTMYCCTMYILYTYTCTVHMYSCIHVLCTYTCTVLSTSLCKKCSIHDQESVKLFLMSAYCGRTTDKKCLNNHLL